MKRKKIFLCGVIVLAIGLLVGCGKSEDEESTENIHTAIDATAGDTEEAKGEIPVSMFNISAISCPGQTMYTITNNSEDTAMVTITYPAADGDRNEMCYIAPHKSNNVYALGVEDPKAMKVVLAAVKTSAELIDDSCFQASLLQIDNIRAAVTMKYSDETDEYDISSMSLICVGYDAEGNPVSMSENGVLMYYQGEEKTYSMEVLSDADCASFGMFYQYGVKERYNKESYKNLNKIKVEVDQIGPCQEDGKTRNIFLKCTNESNKSYAVQSSIIIYDTNGEFVGVGKANGNVYANEVSYCFDEAWCIKPGVEIGKVDVIVSDYFQIEPEAEGTFADEDKVTVKLTQTDVETGKIAYTITNNGDTECNTMIYLKAYNANNELVWCGYESCYGLSAGTGVDYETGVYGCDINSIHHLEVTFLSQ